MTLTVTEIGKHMVCVNCFLQTLLMPVSKVSYINFSGSYKNWWDCAIKKEVAYRKDKSNMTSTVRHGGVTVFLFFFK